MTKAVLSTENINNKINITATGGPELEIRVRPQQTSKEY